MHVVLKAISYIFHPVFMPLLGVVVYFLKSPRAIPTPVVWAKIISITILTIALPVLFAFLLKTLKVISSLSLNSAKERILPLILSCLTIVLILNRLLPYSEFTVLYFFFAGILFSSLTCLILALLNFKVSLHMVGLGGLFMFLIALSIHYSKNLIYLLAVTSLVTGAVATSRLHLKAHNSAELLLGLGVGILPQIIMVNYWL